MRLNCVREVAVRLSVWKWQDSITSLRSNMNRTIAQLSERIVRIGM